MKVNRFTLLGFLIVVLVVSPLLVSAQDDDEMVVDTSEWVELTTEDEIFTVLYPPDWFVGSGEGPGTLFIANNEVLLASMDNEEPALPGDKVIAVFWLFPSDFFAELGVEITKDTTALDLITSLSGLLALDAEGNVENDFEMGEPDILELRDKAEVGVLPVSSESESFEGYFLAYQTEGGVIVFGLAATYLGEWDDEFEATVIAILDNIEINFTAEEIMEVMNL